MLTKRISSVLRRGLRVESLEDRRLMAGDVTAQLINGTLTINEDINHLGEASNISVYKLPNGNTRVAGVIVKTVGNTVEQSLVNGKDFVDFTPGSTAPNLKVNLGDGNDTIHMTGSMRFNDVDLIMTNIAKARVNSSDADTVDINGLITLGSLKISTGDDFDNVVIKKSLIGDGIGATDILDINTGKGSDMVTLGDALSSLDVKGYAFIDTTSGRINGAVNQSEAGDDRVAITSLSVTGSLSLELGGGNDTTDITGSYIGYRLVLWAGDGVDTAKMRDVIVENEFDANMGAGDDRLELYNVDTVYVPPANYTTTSGSMQLDGGTGSDTLIVSLDCNSRWINKLNWEVL